MTGSSMVGGARAMLVLGAVSALPALATDLYLPALPQVSQDLATSSSAAQLTLTALLAGMAAGQLLIGPLSDRVGRRGPLLVGLALFTASSVAAAVAGSIVVLVALRLLQGLGGGAAVVVVQAMVRDQADTSLAAKTYARLLLISGAAPVLAPVLGAQLLRYMPWPGLFAVLGGLGVMLFALATWQLPETLMPSGRHSGGLRQTLAVFGVVIRDRQFIACVAVAAAGIGSLFAYIAASPFVLQQLYGLSQQQYSAVFAVNAAGLIALSQVGARVVHRVGPRRLLQAAAGLACAGGVALLYAALTAGPLWLVLVAFFAVVSSVGVIGPNATALALAGHGERAGSAAALIGVLQFATGAVTGPLTGVAGQRSAVPLGVVCVALTGLAALVAVRGIRPQPQPESASATGAG